MKVISRRFILLVVVWLVSFLGLAQTIDWMDLGTDYVEVSDRFLLKGRGRTFTTDVEEIVLVVRLSIPSSARFRTYNAVVRWYAPDGSLYLEQEVTDLERGYYWSIARRLEVAGTPAAQLAGQWRVEFAVRHGPKGSLSFTLEHPVVRQAPTPSPREEPEQRAGTGSEFSFSDYDFRYVSELRVPYFQDAAWVTLAVRPVGGSSWRLVTDVQVDTGASTSLFPGELATELGLDLQSGERVTFRGVTGREESGWLLKLEMVILLMGGGETDVDGYVLGENGKPFAMTVPVIFSQAVDDRLLGREGVLNYVNLSFEAYGLRIALLP